MKGVLITNCDANKQEGKIAKRNCRCPGASGKLIYVSLSNGTAKCGVSSNDNVQRNCVLLSIMVCYKL